MEQRGLGAVQVKHDGVVGLDIRPIDHPWPRVHPADQPADAPEQRVAAHFKLRHGRRRDYDRLPVVDGACLHQEHLPLFVDQHLHLTGMLQCIKHSLVEQYAVLLQTCLLYTSDAAET